MGAQTPLDRRDNFGGHTWAMGMPSLVRSQYILDFIRQRAEVLQPLATRLLQQFAPCRVYDL